MKFTPYIIAISFLLSHSGFAQSTFVTTLGATGVDQANNIVQTADSGFAVVGTSFTGSTSDMVLARLDKNGNLLWQKKYGGTANDQGLSLVSLPSGGFVLCGNTRSYGSGGDVLLVKTDANGDTLWSKVYGTAGDDYGKVLELTAGGNYRINGVYFAGGTNKPGIMTVDSNGVFIAANFVANQFASPDYRAHYLHGNKMGITGGSEMMIFTDTLGIYSGVLSYGSAAKSIDACYLPQGYYASVYWADYGSASTNAGLLLTDTLGVKVWNKKFTTNDDDLPLWVKPDGHGGILLAVMKRNPSTFNASMVLIAVDLTGAIKWQHTYGINASYDHQPGNVIATFDGGYALVGSYTVGGSFNNYDMLIYKTDSTGAAGCDFTLSNVTVANSIENSASSPSPYSAALVNTGTRVAPVNLTYTGVYTVRCSSVSTSLAELNNADIDFWPNPVKDILYIDRKGTVVSNYTITDLSGRIHSSGNSVSGNMLDLSGLQNGIYFLKLSTSDGSVVIRLIKE
jgi:hypothetical protein